MLKKAINVYPFLPLWYIEKLEKEKEKNYKLCLSLLFVLFSILLIFNYSYNKKLDSKEVQCANYEVDKVEIRDDKKSNVNKEKEIIEKLLSLREEGIIYEEFSMNNQEIGLLISFQDRKLINKYVDNIKAINKIELKDMNLIKEEEGKCSFQLNLSFK